MKLLYATAAHCAAPGCVEPLYKSSGQEGTLLPRLNSRVAHICARCEGVPRWDPSQSEVENRAASNLLLLCIEHAAEIDDASRASRYTVSVLRDWHTQQFSGQQVGRPLSDDEVDEVMRLSFVISQPITFDRSIVILGGQGGQNVGAAGGGRRRDWYGCFRRSWRKRSDSV